MPPSAAERLCVNTIKGLTMDAVEAATCGHPGMPMGMADAAFVLWTRFLVHDPTDPAWPDRDRFVLSAGHGSMLVYSLLHLTGYDLALANAGVDVIEGSTQRLRLVHHAGATAKRLVIDLPVRRVREVT